MRGLNRGQIEYYKDQYPPGTRICLDSMNDDPLPVPAGTKGTVIAVDDQGTIHTKFDNGRSLGICLDADSFHKIFEQTESEDFSPKISM